MQRAAQLSARASAGRDLQKLLMISRQPCLDGCVKLLGNLAHRFVGFAPRGCRGFQTACIPLISDRDSRAPAALQSQAQRRIRTADASSPCKVRNVSLLPVPPPHRRANAREQVRGKRTRAGQSPAPDSNRRPLPYHGGLAGIGPSEKRPQIVPNPLHVARLLTASP